MLEDCLLVSMDPRKPLPVARCGVNDSKKSQQDVVTSKPVGKCHQRRAGKSFDKRWHEREPFQGANGGNSASKKKENLNHLLNFHYARREGIVDVKNTQSLKHKYNKEHFLQANCQFVVKASGNYEAYLSNPDTLVDWNLVEQIRIQSSVDLYCPICLSPPIAARMTRCGHIYCWPCILHYLALSDRNFRSCPICFEAVHSNMLRSVAAIPCRPPITQGETVTMLLMCRQKGSLIATPIGQSQYRSSNQLLSVSETGVATIYSKLLLATPSEVAEILSVDRTQLDMQLLEDQGSPESCFTEQAISLLTEQQRLTETVEESVSEDCHTPDATASGSNSKHFYFYQASDGQHIYLNALNIRMLEMQYGPLEQCPLSIEGRVIEKEAATMNQEVRNRLRYLQHLSITCQFEVVELDLKPPIINREILECFKEQIAARRQRRQGKDNEERKREKKIIEVEKKQLWGGTAVSSNEDVPSLTQFPQCLTSTSSAEEAETVSDTLGPSFAQMLRRTHIVCKSQPTQTGGDLSTAIALALQQAEILQQTAGNTEVAAGNKRQKKKNKKTLLFSTSMGCPLP